MSSLIEDDGRPGWKGPYISYNYEKSSGNYLKSDRFNQIELLNLKKEVAWSPTQNLENGFCADKTDCELWLKVAGLNKVLLKEFDSYIDGKDGGLLGRVRYDEESGELFYNIDLVAKEVKGVSSGIWSTGSWGACSSKCGGGTQSRTVSCEDFWCDEGVKPVASQSCNDHACPIPTYSCPSGYTLSGTKCNKTNYTCKYYKGGISKSYCDDYFIKSRCYWDSSLCNNCKQGALKDKVPSSCGDSRTCYDHYYEACKPSTSTINATATCPDGYTLSGGECI